MFSHGAALHSSKSSVQVAPLKPVPQAQAKLRAPVWFEASRASSFRSPNSVCVHLAPFLHGASTAHSSKSSVQVLPPRAGRQAQRKSPAATALSSVESVQLPPDLHGAALHSSMSVAQSAPEML